jgi:hypothetical protein
MVPFAKESPHFRNRIQRSGVVVVSVHAPSHSPETGAQLGDVHLAGVELIGERSAVTDFNARTAYLINYEV